MADCTPRLTPQCDGEIKSATEKGTCPDWSMCLPFGGRMYSREGCVHVEKGTPPADGVYDRVVIQNGCIVSLEGKQLPIYNPPTCAPEPCSCSDSGGSGSVSVSSQAGNLTREDATGALLTTLNAQAGYGIALQGTGTQRDPLIISANLDPSESFSISAGNSGVIVSGTGTREDPVKISHIEEGYEGYINGMSFDRYGHLTGYTAPSMVSTVNGVIGQGHIKADLATSTGVVTLNIADPMYNRAGEYRLGGFDLTLDDKNFITNITQKITVTPGERYLGVQRVTLTESGTLTEIVDTSASEILVYDHASKRFPSGTKSDAYIITFDLARIGSFRIRYRDCKRPTTSDTSGKTTITPISGTIYVDGKAVDTDVLMYNELSALTTARYGLGSHTVQVIGDMNGVGYLDLEVVTAY